MRSHKPAALAAATALVAVTVTVAMPAHAASDDYASYLRFPDSEPAHALYGPDPTFEGAVSPESPDVVDFQGRGVIDVGTSASLDPQRDDFSFGAVIRLTRGAGDWNIMQKGYWSDPGQWKLSLDVTPDGLRFSCRVRGSAGAVMAYSPVGVVTAAGPWVRVACRRDATSVSVTVDGEVVGVEQGATGNVESDSPYLIGSKGMNAAEPDQFRGLMDYVWVKR